MEKWRLNMFFLRDSLQSSGVYFPARNGFQINGSRSLLSKTSPEAARSLWEFPIRDCMTMRFLTLLLFCIAGLVPLRASAIADPSLLELKGKWKLMDESFDKIGMVIVWEFTATEVIVHNAKTGEQVSRSRYSIDRTKSPLWITIEVDDSPTGDKGDRRLGIFRIQGDELNLKQEISDGGERPAQFDGRFSRFQRQIENKQAEQTGNVQPSARPESKPPGGDKPQPEAEGRSR